MMEGAKVENRADIENKFSVTLTLLQHCGQALWFRPLPSSRYQTGEKNRFNQFTIRRNGDCLAGALFLSLFIHKKKNMEVL